MGPHVKRAETVQGVSEPWKRGVGAKARKPLHITYLAVLLLPSMLLLLIVPADAAQDRTGALAG